MFYKPHFIAYN